MTQNYWQIFFHVNSVPFLTSMSENLHYGSCYAEDNLECPPLEEGLRNIMHCYSIRGFHVSTTMLDIKFIAAKDRGELGVTIKLVSKGEHVSKIYRFHQFFEERAR